MREEFEAYLKCGRLEHGFLHVRCDCCHAEKLVSLPDHDSFLADMDDYQPLLARFFA